MEDLPFSPAFWKLPKIFELKNGKKISLDLLRDDELQDAYSLVDKARGKGLGMDEFLDEESFRYFAARAVLFTITDKDCNKLVGMWLVYPSPICRSFKTKRAAGYAIMDDSYRGKGAFQELNMSLGLLWPLLGYGGLVARIRRSTSTYDEMNTKYGGGLGLLSTGIIPQSQLLHSGARVDDIILVIDMTKNSYPEVRAHIFVMIAGELVTEPEYYGHMKFCGNIFTIT